MNTKYIKSSSMTIILIILLLLSGCENKNRDSVKTKTELHRIDLEYAFQHLDDKKMNFSEFIEDITYLSLETNEKSIFGGRHAPIWNISDNYIFAGDQMFDNDGKYIRKLGKTGQGPGEYVFPLGMTIDEDREKFLVYGNFEDDIFVYDFENNFKKRIKACPLGYNIYSIGSSKILLSRLRGCFFDNFFEYQLIDIEKDSILYTRNPSIMENGHKEKVIPFGMDENLFWAYNNQVSYYEFLSDTVFSLKDGIAGTPRFIVNTGKYKCTLDIMRNTSDAEPANYMRIGMISESKQYLFFSVDYKRILYYAAYDKTTEKIKLNKFDEFFNNDIDGGFLWLFYNTTNGERGYNTILPHIAKERIETLSKKNKRYDKEKNRKLQEFINNLQEDDNQFIVFYKFK